MPFQADSYSSGDLPPFLKKSDRDAMVTNKEPFYISEVRFDGENKYQNRRADRWMLRLHVPTPAAAPVALSLGAGYVDTDSGQWKEDENRKNLFDALTAYLQTGDDLVNEGYGPAVGPFVLTRSGNYFIIRDAEQQEQEFDFDANDPHADPVTDQDQPKRRSRKKAETAQEPDPIPF